MLNVDQIKALAGVGKINVKICNDIPIAMAPVLKDMAIKYPYEAFKKVMGLDSLRLDWLLGKENFIAGGAVLNWIWGEDKNEDTDFFFRSPETYELFQIFIESIGFRKVNSTGYAETFFESSTGVVIQTIGRVEEVLSRDFVAFGTPELVIKNFDFHLCKFAMDHEFVYTTSLAIHQLLQMVIDFTGAQKRNNSLILKRVLKYNKKGFWLSSDITNRIIIDTSKMEDTRFPIYQETLW